MRFTYITLLILLQCSSLLKIDVGNATIHNADNVNGVTAC